MHARCHGPTAPQWFVVTRTYRQSLERGVMSGIPPGRQRPDGICQSQVRSGRASGRLAVLPDLSAPAARLPPACLDELLEPFEVPLDAMRDDADGVARLLHHALRL